MQISLPRTLALILGGLLFHASTGHAAVVVLGNRTSAEVAFTIGPLGEKAEHFSLAAHDVMPIPVTASVVIEYQSGGVRQRFSLEPNTISRFSRVGEKLVLSRMPLADETDGAAPPPSDQTENPEPTPTVGQSHQAAAAKAAPEGVIPVKILVDDNEPAVRSVWEKRLRRRIADVSEIIFRHCRVRFQVVAVGTWESDDRITDFNQSLREFERAVTPSPGMIAIGFTSQYELAGKHHQVGGTRGPFHPYVLVREISVQFTEAERVQTLVHELGHVLGAVHSAEPSSVMRPKMTDRRARAKQFRIHFDEINTLAIYLVCEELRLNKARTFHDFSPQTKRLLRLAYAAMSRASPKDDSVAMYGRLLDGPPDVLRTPAKTSSQLVQAAKAVLDAIVDAASENHGRPAAAAAAAGVSSRLDGDRLTEYLVRKAAAAADQLPDRVAANAFLLGLAVGLDDSGMLRSNVVSRKLWTQVESNAARAERLKVLGTPTMGGRHDLAQHFVVSAGLTVLLGPKAAETLGIAKELRDSRSGSGFSFADISADLAGIAFAVGVAKSSLSLARLSESFLVDDFLPSVDGLQEGISWETFKTSVAFAGSDSFRARRDKIAEQIRALSGYRSQEQ